ncbi:MAG: type IV pilin N-terminal domain-containing protein [Methanoregula sp.]|uniref:type IV pilin n=1 Tax=Methanoregula sp. TaxID=2052170 RepID=UPI003C5306DD
MLLLPETGGEFPAQGIYLIKSEQILLMHHITYKSHNTHICTKTWTGCIFAMPFTQGILSMVFENMAFKRKNEDAVSAVIGVVLMVAVTIIVAAVIATFAFGMAGNLQKTKGVAATASKPSLNEILITYQGGQDASTFSYGLVTITPPAGIAETVTYFNTTGNAQANTTNGSQVIATPSVNAGCSGGSCPLAITGNIITRGSSQGVLGAIVGDWVIGTPSVTNGFAGSCHIIVTGYFTDGSSQVILDTQI